MPSLFSILYQLPAGICGTLFHPHCNSSVRNTIHATYITPDLLLPSLSNKGVSCALLITQPATFDPLSPGHFPYPVPTAFVLLPTALGTNARLALRIELTSPSIGSSSSSSGIGGVGLVRSSSPPA